MSYSTRSRWEEAPLPDGAPLDAVRDVDVLVIGGGITGLTTAHLLQQTGRRVALLEREALGGVDTRRTTAHVTAVTDTRAHVLVSAVGEDHARAAWQGGQAAIDQIAQLVSEFDIDCGFQRVPGHLHVPFEGESSDEDVAGLQQDLRLARAFGFDASYVERTAFTGTPALVVAQQALFDPWRYLAGLTRALLARGVPVVSHAEAQIGDEPGVVHCGGRRLHAPQIVVATHNPMVGRQSMAGASWLQTKLALYTSYALAGTTPQRRPAGLYWDTQDPYRYVRVEDSGAGSAIVTGGEDHKTGTQDDSLERFAHLERWSRRMVPDLEVTHRWSGQVIETPDGLPFVGEVADGQFIATGYAGNGMTFGTLAAMIVREAIDGRPAQPWATALDVHRTAITRGLRDYVTENLDFPTHFVLDRLSAADRLPIEALAPGHGAVVQFEGTKVAAWRDPSGRLTLRSAVCPHMGCIVRWNAAEHSWDCPCHGSRFHADGRVMAGPAEQSLEPLAPQDDPSR